MSKQKGSIKTGGRKKGTPNKRTVDLTQAFEEYGLDVPKHISETLCHLSPQDRIGPLLKLLEFLYPRRKAIEGTRGTPHADLVKALNAYDNIGDLDI